MLRYMQADYLLAGWLALTHDRSPLLPSRAKVHHQHICVAFPIETLLHLSIAQYVVATPELEPRIPVGVD